MQTSKQTSEQTDKSVKTETKTETTMDSNGGWGAVDNTVGESGGWDAPEKPEKLSTDDAEFLSGDDDEGGYDDEGEYDERYAPPSSPISPRSPEAEPEHARVEQRNNKDVNPDAQRVGQNFMKDCGNMARHFTSRKMVEELYNLWLKGVRVESGILKFSAVLFAMAHGLKLLRVKQGKFMSWNRFRDNEGNRIERQDVQDRQNTPSQDRRNAPRGQDRRNAPHDQDRRNAPRDQYRRNAPRDQYRRNAPRGQDRRNASRDQDRRNQYDDRRRDDHRDDRHRDDRHRDGRRGDDRRGDDRRGNDYNRHEKQQQRPRYEKRY